MVGRILKWSLTIFYPNARIVSMFRSYAGMLLGCKAIGILQMSLRSPLVNFELIGDYPGEPDPII